MGKNKKSRGNAKRSYPAASSSTSAPGGSVVAPLTGAAVVASDPSGPAPSTVAQVSSDVSGSAPSSIGQVASDPSGPAPSTAPPASDLSDAAFDVQSAAWGPDEREDGSSDSDSGGDIEVYCHVVDPFLSQNYSVEWREGLKIKDVSARGQRLIKARLNDVGLGVGLEAGKLTVGQGEPLYLLKVPDPSGEDYLKDCAETAALSEKDALVMVFFPPPFENKSAKMKHRGLAMTDPRKLAPLIQPYNPYFDRLAVENRSARDKAEKVVTIQNAVIASLKEKVEISEKMVASLQKMLEMLKDLEARRVEAEELRAELKSEKRRKGDAESEERLRAELKEESEARLRAETDKFRAELKEEREKRTKGEAESEARLRAETEKRRKGEAESEKRDAELRAELKEEREKRAKGEAESEERLRAETEKLRAEFRAELKKESEKREKGERKREAEWRRKDAINRERISNFDRKVIQLNKEIAKLKKDNAELKEDRRKFFAERARVLKDYRSLGGNNPVVEKSLTNGYVGFHLLLGLRTLITDYQLEAFRLARPNSDRYSTHRNWIDLLDLEAGSSDLTARCTAARTLLSPHPRFAPILADPSALKVLCAKPSTVCLAGNAIAHMALYKVYADELKEAASAFNISSLPDGKVQANGLCTLIDNALTALNITDTTA